MSKENNHSEIAKKFGIITPPTIKTPDEQPSQISQIFTGWANYIKDKFDMVIVDADKGKDIVSYLKVKGFPTLISYVNKERAESLVGFDTEGLQHFILHSYKKAVHN